VIINQQKLFHVFISLHIKLTVIDCIINLAENILNRIFRHGISSKSDVRNEILYICLDNDQ